MEKETEQFRLKNLYRACAKLLSHSPWDKLKATMPVAVYNYWDEGYCYAVFLNTDIGWSLRIFWDEQSFLAYMESWKDGYPASGIYPKKDSIAQSYWALYLLKDEWLQDDVKDVCREFAFKWRGCWPIFYRRRPGEPEKIILDERTIIKVTSVLERLDEVLCHVPLEEIHDFADGDFQKGITVRDYVNGKGFVTKQFFIDKLYEQLSIPEYSNPFLLQRLNRIRTDNGFYEMSWFYIPVAQNVGAQSYYPLYANLVDLYNGQVIWSILLDNKEDKEKKMLDSLALTLAERGRKPEYIMTADYRLWQRMASFCSQSGIRLRLIEQGLVKQRISEGFKLMLKDELPAPPVLSEKDKKVVDLKSYLKQRAEKERL